MELKEYVQKVIKKLLSDDKLMDKFEKNPAAVIEDVLGVDVPNELVNEIVKLVKAQLTAEKVGNALEGLGGLFKKN
jgi:hypothetical protein